MSFSLQGEVLRHEKISEDDRSNLLNPTRTENHLIKFGKSQIKLTGLSVENCNNLFGCAPRSAIARIQPSETHNKWKRWRDGWYHTRGASETHKRNYDQDVQNSSIPHGVSRVGEGDARKDCSIE